MGAEAVRGLADGALDAGGVDVGAGGRNPIDMPPERGEGHDRVAGAVQRGPDQLGHPGIDDDLATAAFADVQDPRDEPTRACDERTTWLDGQPRPAGGRRGSPRRSSGISRAKRSAVGAGWSSGKTGNPPPTSSVSKVSIEPRHSAVTARARRTASRQASTAPSWEPTWRWIPRGRSGPSGPPAVLDRRPDLGLGHPELGDAGTHRQPGQRLRGDVGIEPVQDVEGRTAGASRRAPPGPPPPRATRWRSSAAAVRRARHGPRRAGRPASCRCPRA